MPDVRRDRRSRRGSCNPLAGRRGGAVVVARKISKRVREEAIEACLMFYAGEVSFISDMFDSRDGDDLVGAIYDAWQAAYYRMSDNVHRSFVDAYLEAVMTEKGRHLVAGEAGEDLEVCHSHTPKDSNLPSLSNMKSQ